MYAQIIKLSFKQNSVYRANVILNIFGSIISVIIQMSLWTSLIKSGVLATTVSLNDMLLFTVINSIIATLTSANIENVLAQKMRDGSIGVDFIRPINLKYFLFADAMGNNLFYLIFCSIPVCIFAAIFYHFTLPVSFTIIVIFFVALVLGIAISFEISYIFAMISFWVEAVWFISWYTRTLYVFFGGLFIPVWFYPSLLVDISKVLPFYYVAFSQISIYTGKETVHSSLKIILIQVLWFLVLLALEKFIWSRARRVVTVTGG